MAVSLYDIHFNKTLGHQELCTIILDNDQIQRLKEAVEDLYYFEFVFGKIIKG